MVKSSLKCSHVGKQCWSFVHCSQPNILFYQAANYCKASYHVMYCYSQHYMRNDDYCRVYASRPIYRENLCVSSALTFASCNSKMSIYLQTLFYFWKLKEPTMTFSTFTGTVFLYLESDLYRLFKKLFSCKLGYIFCKLLLVADGLYLY